MPQGTIAVKIENIGAFRKVFLKAPEVSAREIRNALDKSTGQIQRTAKQLAPVDTGRLRDSIETELRPLEASVFTTVNYAPFVEFGTRPHFPPISALEVWARRHGVDAGALQKAIGTFGTAATPFMLAAKSQHENDIVENFADALANIEKSLAV